MLDYIIIGTGIIVFMLHTHISWKKYTHNRFVARLKYGEKWYVEDYPYYSIGKVPK